MTSILDGSESYVPFSWLDTSGNPYTPTSISYQVWDETNNVQVVAPTPITAVQSGNITLNSTVNTMNSVSALIEQREVVVTAGIPGGSFDKLSANYTLIRVAGGP